MYPYKCSFAKKNKQLGFHEHFNISDVLYPQLREYKFFVRYNVLKHLKI